MEKKRLDPRVRFQHANFTRKLHQARNYKRASRPRPDSRLQVGLEKVGMASLLAQLLFAATAVVVVYLMYVPNPLFIRGVRIEGLSEEYQSAVQEAVKNYQNDQPWYAPANNILFVNRDALANFIAANVPAISKIESTHKSFRGKTLSISVVQKYERYIVVRPEDELVLYNDGAVKGRQPLMREDSFQSGAWVILKVNDSSSVDSGEMYFDPKFLELIEDAATLLPEQTGQNLAYFEAKLPERSLNNPFRDSWKESAIVAVVNKKPGTGKSNPPQLRVILEPGLDIAAAASRLKLLLEQTTPERYRNLLYADLRLPNRAYLCLINTPCANTNP